MPPKSTPGFVVRSDEATIAYLLHHNEQQRGDKKFVLRELRELRERKDRPLTALFVKKAALQVVQAVLRHRLQETVWEDEDEEAA